MLHSVAGRFVVLLLLLFVLCDSESDPVSAELDAKPLNGQGVVEGVVTLGGEAVGGVSIRADYSTLSKAADETMIEEQSAETEKGFYRLILPPGTYELSFYIKIRSSERDGYDHYDVDSVVEVVADSITRLNIEMVGWGPNFDLWSESLGDRQVTLAWENGNTEGYDLYRSEDLQEWVHLPESGDRYTTLSRYYRDTVEKYGTYYYKVRFVDRDSKTEFESDTAIVSVGRSFPSIDRAILSDSALFVSCEVRFEDILDTYHLIEVLRAEKRANDFQTVFRTPFDDRYSSPSSRRHSYEDIPVPSFAFKDTLEPNLYFYRFIAHDTVGEVASDTSEVYSIDFGGETIPPMFELTDSITFISLTVYGNRAPYLDETRLVVYRSVNDTSHFIALDTIPAPAPSPRSRSVASYTDHDAPHDTLFYTVQLFYKDKPIGEPARPQRIIHTGKPPAPLIYNVEDSGRALYVEIDPAYDDIPVALWRLTSTDSVFLGTLDCGTGYNKRCTYLDSTRKAGYFSYVTAHLDTDGTAGEFSERIGAYTHNRLPGPSLGISSKLIPNTVTITIKNVYDADKYVILRKSSKDETRTTLDTIPAPSAGIHSDKTYYSDSTANFGFVQYTVYGLDERGKPGSEAYISMYYAPE